MVEMEEGRVRLPFLSISQKFFLTLGYWPDLEILSFFLHFYSLKYSWQVLILPYMNLFCPVTLYLQRFLMTHLLSYFRGKIARIWKVTTLFHNTIYSLASDIMNVLSLQYSKVFIKCHSTRKHTEIKAQSWTATK